ncbi:MAG: GTPase Era [Clostridia bacterium]|nr:GTPase Era [Clostridia bacterium]MBR2464863.1 GTPase Era [Clostridia bacterium]MBR3862673.1 GTPase Era [Clostridia bacterium]
MKKSGYIAIVGRPNVGKSTLLNALLGEKIAIVSNKPQTTRNRILGILTRGEAQFVFIDTPGIHKPQNSLGDFMVETANASMKEADALVLMVDAGREITAVEENVMRYLKQSGIPAVLALNKTDLYTAVEIAESIKRYAAAHDFAAVVPLCAKNGKQVFDVLDECEKLLAESEWFFPDDMITDQPERQIAAEIIREKLLRTLNKEVPHGVAVVIEEFKDEGNLVRIRAEIFCEKASHKGIIVGKNGAELKMVGTYARQDLEKLFGTKVYLNLWVKVKENWRDSRIAVGNFGYREEK